MKPQRLRALSFRNQFTTSRIIGFLCFMIGFVMIASHNGIIATGLLLVVVYLRAESMYDSTAKLDIHTEISHDIKREGTY